ncbi:hypothetical protein DRF60_15055 [Chryseobacterium elymi]|uniref:DUF6602 domain-containing protein n=1 Tax=Chryseobacterium elymi TaxID=395936 RepID=A0A3D9DCS6_9FLAO|nr:DUF6602 domain-containing protein [Chryseobacterium elymi]REC75827.1 hypothetical protein DRF60_15055 [Chryseobacterium elymi]
MNDYYRTILDGQIKKALSDAKSAIQLKHPYLTGRLREIVLHQLFEPLLNNNYSIGNGKIIDYDGNISSEIDICIYSKNLHPPIFFSTNDKLGLFPIESVLKTIEVKSVFNMRNLKDTFAKFNDLDQKLICTPALHDENNYAIPTHFIKPHYSLFTFDINQKNYKPEKILEMYSDIDENWETLPLISSICIANKGWLCNTQQGWIHKAYNDNNTNDEIVGFLTTMINDLPRIELSRGNPQIGYYLFDAINIDKFIDRKFINKPWGEGKYIIKNKELENHQLIYQV